MRLLPFAAASAISNRLLLALALSAERRRVCPECARTMTDVSAGSPAAVVSPQHRRNVAMQRPVERDVGAPVPELPGGEGEQLSDSGNGTLAMWGRDTSGDHRDLAFHGLLAAFACLRVALAPQSSSVSRLLARRVGNGSR
jgi:hypothetical protein